MDCLNIVISAISCLTAMFTAGVALKTYKIADVTKKIAETANDMEKKICFGAQLSAKIESVQNKDATHKLTIYNDGNGTARKISATLNDGYFIDNECYNPNNSQVNTVSIDLLRKGIYKEFDNVRIEPIPEPNQVYLTIEWNDDYKKKNQKRIDL